MGRCPTTCRRIRPLGGRASSGAWPCSSSRASPPALAFVCPRGAAWWFVSARAIATLRRSCRSHCLSRRCRLLMAACSAIEAVHMKVQKKVTCTKRSNLRTPRKRVCLNLGWWWWWWTLLKNVCVFLHTHARRMQLIMGRRHVPVDMPPKAHPINFGAKHEARRMKKGCVRPASVLTWTQAPSVQP